MKALSKKMLGILLIFAKTSPFTKLYVAPKAKPILNIYLKLCPESILHITDNKGV